MVGTNTRFTFLSTYG